MNHRTRNRKRARVAGMILGGAAVLGACGGEVASTGSLRGALTAADCPPGTNVVEGTAGDDVLRGTTRDDCILGYGGDDHLIGRRGNDVLAGGDGDDVVEGGDGFDTLYGEAGEDLLLGGAGDDTLVGGDASDVIDGEAGSDVAEAEGGNDAVAPVTEVTDGGDGYDVCNGTSCEASNYLTCKSNTDCAPEGRCLHGKACVSCRGDDTCRGTLNIVIEVEQACPEGFVLNGSGKCVPII